MPAVEWPNVKHFKPNSKIDRWGNPSKMDYALIVELDRFREYLKTPIMVNDGFRPGKIASQHYLGKAVDIIVPDFPGHILDLFFAASRFLKFTGIGVYPGWQYKGVTTGGLHLDNRDAQIRALWMRIAVWNQKKKDFEQVYRNLSFFELKNGAII